MMNSNLDVGGYLSKFFVSIDMPLPEEILLFLTLCSAYRTALCKSKRGGFKDTYPDDLLAPVLRVISASSSMLFLGSVET